MVVCHSCGFVLYSGKEPKSIDDVLRKWGYRCPCCLSILKPKIQGYMIEVSEHESEKLEPEQDYDVAELSSE